MSKIKIISKTSSRRRGVLLALAAALPVIIIFSAVIIFMPSEALSPEEILSKEEWSDSELQDALSRSISPAMITSQKKEIMQHLGRQLNKRSQADRERIRKAAVVQAVTTSLQQVRKMPSQDRQNLINNLHDKAQKNYDTLRKSNQARQQFAKQMQSQEAEVFANEVNRVIFSEFTPEERVQFAPVTKVWIKTMKLMEH